jgi:hypothetical protein
MEYLASWYVLEFVVTVVWQKSQKTNIVCRLVQGIVFVSIRHNVRGFVARPDE